MPLKQPNKSSLPQTEWFYPFHIENVPSSTKVLKMVAEPTHLKAIAKRLGILDIADLQAELKLSLQNGGHILYISGSFKAEIVQECVVTLKPVISSVADSFEAWFADHDKAVSFNRAKHQLKAIEEGDEVQILEEKDDPEALIDGQVDLGEVVVQFLSLAVNPYPRSEKIEGDDISPLIIEDKKQSSSSTSLRPNPFAALKNWRPKD